MANMSLDRENVTTANLSADDRTSLSEALGDVLSSYTVYWMKLQNVHWNLTGPLFYTVHELTEQHYREVFETIDAVAERIRALGVSSPGTLQEMLKRSQVDELDPAKTVDAKDMIGDVTTATKRMSAVCKIAHDMADKVDDQVTCDMMIERMHNEDKFAWMLGSLLG